MPESRPAASDTNLSFFPVALMVEKIETDFQRLSYDLLDRYADHAYCLVAKHPRSGSPRHLHPGYPSPAEQARFCQAIEKAANVPQSLAAYFRAQVFQQWIDWRYARVSPGESLLSAQAAVERLLVESMLVALSNQHTLADN